MLIEVIRVDTSVLLAYLAKSPSTICRVSKTSDMIRESTGDIHELTDGNKVERNTGLDVFTASKWHRGCGRRPAQRAAR